MKRILEQVNAARTIALLPHVRADGDSIGSCHAMAELLRELHKEPVILLEEEPLSRFSYLPLSYRVYGGEPEEFDLVIAIDCADSDRLGKRAALFRGRTACIDHHATGVPMGEVSYVDPHAAAAAELIYLFAEEAGVMNLSAAAGIYTGLSTDSGSFRYSNTTPRTLRIAARLIELGLDTAEINRRLYEEVTLGSLRFQAECVEQMQLFSEGKIAVTVLTLERAAKLGLTPDDTEGGGSLMLSIRGVCAGAFFHEREPGSYKVSLRANRLVDVAQIAAAHGGGGHLRASGYTAAGPLQEEMQTLVAQIQEQLGAL